MGRKKKRCKENFLSKKERNRHHSLLRKTMEKLEKEIGLQNHLGFGSRLCIGKVLAPYDTLSKMVPLIR